MGLEAAPAAEDERRGRKRKTTETRVENLAPLEIDINAPEPSSKKALRKSKRLKTSAAQDEASPGTAGGEEAAKVKGNESSKPRAAPSKSPWGIWIGNLPFHVTRDHLHTFITGDKNEVISLDQIQRIHLPKGAPKPGFDFQNKGYAHIDFQSAEAVEKALRLSEKLVGGRRVLIKSSSDFKGRPETPKSAMSKEPSSKRIFVGNLEFDIRKEDLERHFQVCGPIHNVHMATFEDSGKCKGYAWIEFQQLSSAESAMKGWVEKAGKYSGAGEDQSESKGGRKKIRVNRMGERKLRMEFAEDKTTRYKKRYGKDSRPKAEEGAKAKGENGDSAVYTEGTEEVLNKGPNKPELAKPKKIAYAPQPRTGYSAASIQKMTGAIADGEGTKTTFD